jgi:hypothetical protein
MPIKSSERFVAEASFVIEMLEVFEANMQSLWVILSKVAKSSILASTFSTIASMTREQLEKSSKL